MLNMAMAEIAYHSPLAHSAYYDLLNALRDETVSELRGAPTRVERNGRIYWYDSYRVGTEVKKAYIGEDSPELRHRLDKAAAIKAAADGPMKGVLGYTEEKLVSSDFNHDPHSSVFHMDQTKVMEGRLCRILTWYDNEWGFSNRMSDTAVAMGKLI